MPTIDIHCHIVPEACLPMEAIGLDGKPYGMKLDKNPDGSLCHISDGRRNMPACDPDQLWSVERRLREMDRDRVDIQILNPPPFLFFYSVALETAAKFARKINVELSKIVASRRDRFLGLATVPLQDPEAATKELEFAIRDLGLHGVEICSSVPGGKDLAGPEYYPFFDMLAKLDVPVYVHPYYVPADAAAKLSRYSVGSIVYAPIDVGLFIASTIFNGFHDRYPNLKMVFANGGGPAAFLVGRWNYAHAKRKDCNEGLKHRPIDYLKRLYFETLCYDPRVLEYLIPTVGASQLVLGTGYPFDMTDDDAVGAIESLAIAESERAAIRGDNLARVFGIK